MDWNLILEIALKALGSVLATVLIALLSVLFTKLKNKIKEARIISFIKETVKAAEQLYPNNGKKMGKEKYAYVVNQVLYKFPNLVENDYLKNLIEGAVFTVSEMVKQAAKIEEKTNNNINNTLSSF